MGGKRGFWRGSYTVEAALVVSIVLFVLSGCLFAAFYIHDRAVLQGSVCEMAATGSNVSVQSGRQQAVNAVRSKMTDRRLLGSRNRTGAAFADDKTVQASWNAVYSVPGFVTKYFAGSRLNISQSWKTKILDPADLIWKIRGIGELVFGGDT